MKKIFLLMAIATILMITGCSTQTTQEENIIDFPVLEGSGEPGSTNYFVCESAENGRRILKYSRCGDDTCWHTFYERDGEVLEETPEVGPGTPGRYEIMTETKNCLRTTGEYFKSQVEI